MPLLLDLLEAAGELVDGTDRYSQEVRRELESMSAATIDRYLATAGAKDQLRGKSTTKAGPPVAQHPSGSARPAGEARAAGGVLRGQSPSPTAARCPQGVGLPAPRNHDQPCSPAGAFTRPMRGRRREAHQNRPRPGRGQYPLPHHGHGLANNGSEFTQPRGGQVGCRPEHLLSRHVPGLAAGRGVGEHRGRTGCPSAPSWSGSAGESQY